MGIATLPAAAGGGIKSVQRGSAGGSGNVTITAVDIAKSFVTVFGTASSGTVSASFNMNLNAGNMALQGVRLAVGNNNFGYMPTGASTQAANRSYGSGDGASSWTKTVGVNAGSASVGAGSTNLVAAVVQGYLSNSTTLVVSGACRYEVVEFA